MRIPIEGAIELVARQGIPPQRAPKDPKLYPPQAGTRETGFEGKWSPNQDETYYDNLLCGRLQLTAAAAISASKLPPELQGIGIDQRLGANFH